MCSMSLCGPIKYFITNQPAPTIDPKKGYRDGLG